MEIVWTGIASLIEGDSGLRGFTSLWMFVIYGTAVFLEPLHDIMRKWKWPARGLIWVVIIWGIEYTSGMILSDIAGIRPWIYMGAFSVEGYIRLDYAPAWFAAGMIFERIHHTLDTYNIA